MEKFAVDLDKVLNDFEYNEEHLNEYSSSQRTINVGYDRNYAKNARPFRAPASDYQRPPFEPVSLADADFSVSTRQPVQSNYVIPLYSEAAVNVPVFDEPVPSKDVNNSVNEPSSIDSPTFSKSKEFKPDLIESNADLSSSSNDYVRAERHLPDVASANIEVKDEKVNFDLISNSVDRDSESLDSGADKSQDVLRFPVTSDVSDSELHQYLEELDQCEFAAENQNRNEIGEEPLPESNVDENSDKVLIKVEPERLYLEKSQVAVNESESISTDDEVEANEVGAKMTLCLDTSTGDVTTIESNECVETPISEDVKTESSIVDLTDSADVGNDSDSIETKILTEESSVDFDSKHLEATVSESVTSAEAQKTDAQPLVEDSETNECDSSAISEMTNESSLESEEAGSKCEDEIDSEEPKPSAGYAQTDAVDKDPSEGMKADKQTADVSSNVISSDNQVPSSETNYQILDSRAAISTFERSCDDGAVAGCSKEESESATGSENETKPKLQRPDSLSLTHTTQPSEMSSTSADSGSLLSSEERKLGKEQPFWIPDSETSVCMQCQLKFTLVKRRHHCRACGLVLCSKCCDMKAKLEYLGFEEARVCHSCHSILQRINNLEAEISSLRRPNPNNPMEYCSTIPPPLQVGPTQPSPPSVLVPVSVLKREGRSKSDTPKQVIFSDGIRPGTEPTDGDVTTEARISSLRRHTRVTKRASTPPGNLAIHRRMLNAETKSFIPSTNDLPPMINKVQGEFIFSEAEQPITIDNEPMKFAINRNLFVIVKRIILDCCVNRDVWCMTTEGLSCVGQDEIVFLLEVLPEEKHPPKDVFLTVNMLYQEASKGNTVTEMSYATPCLGQLFDSKDHGGFVFIRPSYQCIQKLLLPKAPYLIALLIHRWETPWARLFPIRLVLRLGAEYRYYPCPLVSIRNRPALFTDIGHTIISLLADFRKYSYSLPSVRGLMIHMEDRLTTILLPRNRYDQVIRAMNNSEENVLAFAGNISTQADSHLVCIQSTQDDTSYTTQAINIHNKPRQVTGASFIVFNGSLKQTAWAGKSNIVEDGLMVQIPSESMSNLRSALKQMKDYSIGCGPQAEEVVVLKWAPDDINFNIGVRSNIDGKPLDGIPSIRVHNGIDYSGAIRLIRWTEVFLLQSDEQSESKTGDSVNINKLSESIARATCIALVPLLDLLATANLTTIAVRATIHPENVGYEAGSQGEKLPPIYMRSLDETLIAVVHEAAVAIRDISSPTVLELIFKVMEQE